ncbi:hypothetical protein BDL97_18G065500 [Sphagnum fallax]|nr:hypothetical protein BDL97_18G065500 [Sphagnum fallax]
MTPVRPSIVNRRIRPASVTNIENIDKEFKEQLKDLYVKQENYEYKKERVRKTVSPKREDTVKLQVEMKRAMEDQLKRKEEDEKIAKEDEHKLFCYNEYHRRFVAPHGIEITLERTKARRDYLKALMEENKRTEALKKELQQREKQDEIEAEHLRAINPCSWNRRHYL